MHCFIVSIAKLTSIPQEVVDFTKKQKERKEKERHRKKQHIRNNIKSAGEPICKTKWHHSPFLYAIKREFLKDTLWQWKILTDTYFWNFPLIHIVVIDNAQLLLFWNGLDNTQDGRVKIETRYFKVTFVTIFLLLEHEIFLKSKLQIA